MAMMISVININNKLPIY